MLNRFKALQRFWLVVLLGLGLSGCATLQPGFEKPVVNLTSFELLPSNGVAPKFGIGLHVINPNRTPLSLKGLVYNVEIEGHKILTGVANDLPVIAAYGEGDIQLQASANLFNTLRMLSSLVNRPSNSLTYDLNAKLDVGSLLPRVEVNESGKIDLSRLNK
ncbi:LEA type 2 family protein [Motiliproteus sp.]|uniref:LEA type 2 family protein n=1 Tax=Motiliproteus sp. TaxID=1898955 RepID=UPI003BAB6743